MKTYRQSLLISCCMLAHVALTGTGCHHSHIISRCFSNLALHNALHSHWSKPRELRLQSVRRHSPVPVLPRVCSLAHPRAPGRAPRCWRVAAAERGCPGRDRCHPVVTRPVHDDLILPAGTPARHTVSNLPAHTTSCVII